MKKPSTTVPDMTNWTESKLLQAAADIFVQSGPLSDEQLKELAAIDREFERRDSLTLAG
jgi:hypothetical protein